MNYLELLGEVDFLDFGLFSVLVNIAAALAALGIMQRVTCDWDSRSTLGWIKFAHRFVWCILAMTLLFNAGWTVYFETDPRPVDILLQLAFLMVLLCSTLRHLMVMRKR